MRHFSRLLLAGAIAGLTACAAPPPRPDCTAGFNPMASALLYFGANAPDGTVSPAQWQAFLDAEVTPRFPDGYSVWSASGQWRSSSGAIEREPARVLNVVHAARESDAQALAEIAAAYRQRFQQESVLHVDTPVCARF